jgi:hypothetical protein
MTGNTPGGTRTAEQVRWSNYYLMRDIEQAGDALNLLKPIPYVPGNLGVGAPSKRENKYHPVDLRRPSVRRRNLRAYNKAQIYYGKTYIVPRAQMIWVAMICVGASLMLGSATALAVLYSFN